MLQRNKVAQPVGFDKGVDLANWIAENGWGGEGSTEAGLISFDNYTYKELVPGAMADIVNLKFVEGGNGTLTQRDVVSRVPMPAGKYPNNTGNKKALYLVSRGSPANNRTVFMIHDTVTNSCDVYWTDGTTTTLWFTKTILMPQITSGYYLECVYYDPFWYFYIPGSSSYFKVDGAGTVTDYSSATITDGIRQPVMYRERVFGFAGSKVYYSKPTDPTDFTPPNGGYFILGTGQPIQQILLYRDQLWCVDTGGSLWKVYFSNDPSEDGVVRRVSEDVNVLSLVVSDNRLWAATNRNVFELVNEQMLPVGNQLWLQGGKYSNVQLLDLGTGLMLVTNYLGLESTNTRIFVYDYRQNAWVRYEFPWFDDATKDTFVTITGATFAADADRFNVYLELGAPTQRATVGVGQSYYPFYQLHRAESSDHSDAYVRVFDGNGNVTYQRVMLKLKSGPLYMGKRHLMKRFHYMMMHAFLGWKSTGPDVINKTPFLTKIQYIPVGMADKDNRGVVQRVGPSEHASTPYRISINQRARGIVFTFETEDKEYWNALQNVVAGTKWSDLSGFTWNSLLNNTWDSLSPTEVPSPIYIDGLELLYTPIERARSRDGSNAFVDSYSE